MDTPPAWTRLIPLIAAMANSLATKLPGLKRTRSRRWPNLDKAIPIPADPAEHAGNSPRTGTTGSGAILAGE